VGANARVDAGCDDVDYDELMPRVSAIKDDTANAYECYTQETDSGQLKSCTYGSDQSDATKVALTGDSHAAMLLPALLPQFSELNWSVDTYLGRGCSWAVRDDQPQCEAYREALAETLADGGYDIVIVTAYRAANDTASRESIAESRAAAWKPVLDAGIDVLVVSDNPHVPDDMVECVSENPDEALRGDACILPASQESTPEDPQLRAVELEPRARLVDLRDLFCDDGGCPMVIGGTVVYRDQHHMTAAYARSVGPTLVERIRAALAAG
jgi:hypothetical protein